MDRKSDVEARNILPECIIPVMALCFTVYYLTTITEVPWISQASAVVVSSLLMLTLIAFAIRSAVQIRRGQATLRLDLPGRRMSDGAVINIKRVVLLLLSIGYVWIIDRWGFTITTFFFLFFGILLLSSLANWKKALIVALSCSVIGYVVFIFIFETRFPRGPVEELLKGWMT